MKTTVVFGRMSIAAQELSLKKKTHIVVGTPGRIYDLIQRGSLKLGELNSIIIDEADEMFFIGLREQVERILACCEKPHRTMLFSATLGDEVIQIASEYMKSPEMIDTKEDSSKECDIEQFYIKTSLMEKPDLLSKVLLQYRGDRKVT